MLPEPGVVAVIVGGEGTVTGAFGTTAGADTAAELPSGERVLTEKV
jgi:hypothetical protein